MANFDALNDLLESLPADPAVRSYDRILMKISDQLIRIQSELAWLNCLGTMIEDIDDLRRTNRQQIQLLREVDDKIREATQDRITLRSPGQEAERQDDDLASLFGQASNVRGLVRAFAPFNLQTLSMVSADEYIGPRIVLL